MADDRLLLDLYRNEGNLWDSSHRDYFNRERRRESILHISQQMGNHMTKEVVKKKINSFRTMYSRHLARLKASKRKEGSGVKVYTPKWKWFSYLDTFLRPHVLVRGDSGNTESDKPAEEAAAPSGDILQLMSQVKQEDGQQPSETFSTRSWSSASSECASPSLQDEEMNESDVEEDPEYKPVIVPSFTAPFRSPAKGNSNATVVCAAESPNSVDAVVTDIQIMISDLRRSIVEREERKRENTGLEDFANFIVGELAKLPAKAQRKAKFQIHQLIYDLGEEEDS